jgi:hypothetical protein
VGRRGTTGAEKITVKPEAELEMPPFGPISPCSRSASSHFPTLTLIILAFWLRFRGLRESRARAPGGKVDDGNSQVLSSYEGRFASSGEREAIKVIEPMVS